jgi:competence protein ComEC
MRNRVLCAILIIFLLLAGGYADTNTPLTVSYIDVGQGDSELIQFPSGNTMLIDAGPSAAAGLTVTNYLNSKGISSIDTVVATHPDLDHIGGMSKVLNGFTVKQFIDSGYPHTSTTYEGMLSTIDAQNIPFRTVTNGDMINLDPNISIDVLNPQSTFFAGDTNPNSVALKMTYGKVTFLFPGDAGTINDPAEILKVPHHGSNTGLSSLSQVNPKVSIITVGANSKYGHPTDTVLQALEGIGSKIYRTDVDGTITITSDGNTYTVYTEKTGVGSTIEPVSSGSTPVNSIAPCDCSENVYNCPDFPLSNGVSAQECYDYCKATGRGDIHGLDRDKDYLACKSS